MNAQLNKDTLLLLEQGLERFCEIIQVCFWQVFLVFFQTQMILC